MNQVFEKDFLFELPEEQIRELSQKLAEGVQTIESMKEARKIAIKEHNIKILDQQKAVDKLARIVASGAELRPVTCKWRKVFERATVDLVRLDNMQVVESRPMDEDEKQLGLPIDDGAGEGEEAA